MRRSQVVVGDKVGRKEREDVGVKRGRRDRSRGARVCKRGDMGGDDGSSNDRLREFVSCP